MREIRHAVILAAGRGTRMFPLTELVPKPMVPFRGGSLIGHGIAALKQHSVQIHITVGYKRADLAQHVIELGVDSVINTEGQTNAWFLFHSLLQFLDEPLLVLTCDNVTTINLAELSSQYFDLGAPPCMLVPVHPVPGVEGDFIHQDGPLVQFLSRTRAAPTYCSGMQVVNPTAVRKYAPMEGDFSTVWDQLISNRMLHASRPYPYEWMSIDTIDALRAAEKGGGDR
jgi:NDP-sugar pyrophosphorylase family protein